MKLVDAITTVRHAIGRDPTRENLQAIHFEPDMRPDGLERESVVAVATDGHRLAVARLPADTVRRPVTVSVVDAPWRSLRRLTEYVHGELTVAREADAALIGKPRGTNDFVDWRAVVSEPRTSSTLVIDRAELLAALERLRGVVRDQDRQDKLVYELAVAEAKVDLIKATMSAVDPALAAAKSKYDIVKIRLENRQPVVGVRLQYDGRFLQISPVQDKPEAKESIDIGAPASGPVIGPAIGVCVHYLLDAVQALRGTTVSFSWTDPLSPVRFDNTDRDGYAIIMPVRL